MLQQINKPDQRFPEIEQMVAYAVTLKDSGKHKKAIEIAEKVKESIETKQKALEIERALEELKTNVQECPSCKQKSILWSDYYKLFECFNKECKAVYNLKDFTNGASD